MVSDNDDGRVGVRWGVRFSPWGGAAESAVVVDGEFGGLYEAGGWSGKDLYAYTGRMAILGPFAWTALVDIGVEALHTWIGTWIWC